MGDVVAFKGKQKPAEVVETTMVEMPTTVFNRAQAYALEYGMTVEKFVWDATLACLEVLAERDKEASERLAAANIYDTEGVPTSD